MRILEVVGLTCRVGRVAVLDALSFTVEEGEIFALCGPPGAGKSVLLSALLKRWRDRDATVAMLAVDPSSRHSGGALLGDRARIEFDASDRGVFIRSTSAGERLGGLAWATRAAAQ